MEKLQSQLFYDYSTKLNQFKKAHCRLVGKYGMACFCVYSLELQLRVFCYYELVDRN